MKASEKERVKFTFTEELKNRASELLDESQGVQFAEGLRLTSGMGVVFDREAKRLRQKYGENDERTKEMFLRREASTAAKIELFSRYTNAMTPPARAGKGWAVDGFVRDSGGTPLYGLTVAAYDRQENLFKELGHASTDDRGYFSITVAKFPEKFPRQVFMRASKGKRLLPSNEVSLAPAPGLSERVEIIIAGKEKEKDPREDSPNPADKPNQRTSTPDREAAGTSTGTASTASTRAKPAAASAPTPKKKAGHAVKKSARAKTKKRSK